MCFKFLKRFSELELIVFKQKKKKFSLIGITLHLLACYRKLKKNVSHQSVRDRRSIQLHSSVGET